MKSAKKYLFVFFKFSDWWEKRKKKRIRKQNKKKRALIAALQNLSEYCSPETFKKCCADLDPHAICMFRAFTNKAMDFVDLVTSPCIKTKHISDLFHLAVDCSVFAAFYDENHGKEDAKAFAYMSDHYQELYNLFVVAIIKEMYLSFYGKKIAKEKYGVQVYHFNFLDWFLYVFK